MDKISLGAELSKQIHLWKKDGQKVGFVPTMGALHHGHISLIQFCGTYCERTVCSIFVNPTQFNDRSDFEKYPRLVESDVEMLEKSGCDLVFLPEVTEIYPHGQKTEIIDYGAITSSLEAAMRPGHFDGVVAVLRRFFSIVEPDMAFFGEKDFQQLALVKELCKREFPTIEVIACPTVRESSGLAMSSRNQRLSPEGRKRAAQIYKELCGIAEAFGKASIPELILKARLNLEKDGHIDVEYLHLIDSTSFEELDEAKAGCRLVIAAWIEGLRLIDNISI